MQYLMILPVRYYRIDESNVSLESAFVEHLKMLKKEMSPFFDQMLVAMVEMSEEEYRKVRSSHSVLDEKLYNISVVSHYLAQDVPDQGFWPQNIFIFYLNKGFSYFKNLFELVRDADLVHGGPSLMWSPLSFAYVIFVFLLGKKSVFVVDIDFRKSGWMLYRSGKLSWKSYWLERCIYIPFLSSQILIARFLGSLVLLKGQLMTRDYGKNYSNVKNFLDASHSASHIISDERLNQKLAKARNHETPLKLTYFGRLVDYKGIDKCLEAIYMAQQKTTRKIEFHIIGAGDREDFLRDKTLDFGLEENVFFHGSCPFGPKLFEILYEYHLLLASPMKEDTPRNALDAMAAGIPVLAFDTYYYKSLEESGAVKTVEWMSIDQLASAIVEMGEDSRLLTQMMMKGVDFARRNTQEIWLDKRIKWTMEMF